MRESSQYWKNRGKFPTKIVRVRTKKANLINHPQNKRKKILSMVRMKPTEYRSVLSVVRSKYKAP